MPLPSNCLAVPQSLSSDSTSRIRVTMSSISTSVTWLPCAIPSHCANSEDRAGPSTLPRLETASASFDVSTLGGRLL